MNEQAEMPLADFLRHMSKRWDFYFEEIAYNPRLGWPKGTYFVYLGRTNGKLIGSVRKVENGWVPQTTKSGQSSIRLDGKTLPDRQSAAMEVLNTYEKLDTRNHQPHESFVETVVSSLLENEQEINPADLLRRSQMSKFLVLPNPKNEDVFDVYSRATTGDLDLPSNRSIGRITREKDGFVIRHVGHVLVQDEPAHSNIEDAVIALGHYHKQLFGRSVRQQ